MKILVRMSWWMGISLLPLICGLPLLCPLLALFCIWEALSTYKWTVQLTHRNSNKLINFGGKLSPGQLSSIRMSIFSHLFLVGWILGTGWQGCGSRFGLLEQRGGILDTLSMSGRVGVGSGRAHYLGSMESSKIWGYGVGQLLSKSMDSTGLGKSVLL